MFSDTFVLANFCSVLAHSVLCLQIFTSMYVVAKLLRNFVTNEVAFSDHILI